MKNAVGRDGGTRCTQPNNLVSFLKFASSDAISCFLKANIGITISFIYANKMIPTTMLFLPAICPLIFCWFPCLSIIVIWCTNNGYVTIYLHGPSFLKDLGPFCNIAKIFLYGPAPIFLEIHVERSNQRVLWTSSNMHYGVRKMAHGEAHLMES